jgi:hypothetical protein
LAQLPEKLENHYDIVDLASLKLTCGLGFDAKDKNHVFAVLSQRLCLEPIPVASEAVALADRSVANHMRLITGISNDSRIFHTYSPLEPILALGAVDILYQEAERLGQVLNTFTKDLLCSDGLVEKGLTGELAARILLLLARDFAAPKLEGGRNLLKPVPLLSVIDTLFGNTTWAGSDECRVKYKDAFGKAYVNFTHWIVTKDPLPKIPDQ